MQDLLTNAVLNGEAKAQELNAATQEANQLLNKAKPMIAKACAATNQADVDRAIADQSTTTEKTLFEELATFFHSGGWLVVYYSLKEAYSEIGQSLRDAIAKQVWNENPEILALYLTTDVEAVKAMTGEQATKRRNAQLKINSLIQYMVDHHRYLDNVVDRETDHAIYTEERRIAAKESGDPEKYNEDHPFVKLGTPNTVWDTSKDAISKHVAATQRKTLGLIAPAIDIARHLAGVQKVMDREVDGDLEFAVSGVHRENMVVLLAEFRDELQAALPNDWQKSEALVNAMDNIPNK